MAPFFVLFITSAPIGLCSITLWKDIPFSTAVVAVSFLVYRVQIEREVRGKFIAIKAWQYPLIVLLFVLACQTRHNGLILYPLLAILLFGRIKKVDYAGLLVFVLVGFFGLNSLVPGMLGIMKTTSSPAQQLRTAVAIMTHPNYYSKDRQADIRAVEEATGMSWEKIQSLYPAHWFQVWDLSDLNKKQFMPGFGETKDYNKQFIFRLSQENLPILLASRTFEFFHSVGIDQSKSNETNGYYENPCQLHGSNLHPPGHSLYGVSVASRPKSEYLRSLLERYRDASMEFEGLFSKQVLVWNLLIYFAIFLAILFFERGFCAINLFILPIMAVAAGVYMTGAGESWRYFYYVYLSGILVVPLYICYRLETRPIEKGRRSAQITIPAK